MLISLLIIKAAGKAHKMPNKSSQFSTMWYMTTDSEDVSTGKLELNLDKLWYTVYVCSAQVMNCRTWYIILVTNIYVTDYMDKQAVVLWHKVKYGHSYAWGWAGNTLAR